jgi:uncharacterized protein YbbC (DUF1343 family)
MLRLTAFIFFFFGAIAVFAQHDLYGKKEITRIKPGAEQTDIYIGMLTGKNVALVVNQTSRINDELLVDTLKRLGVHIKTIFAPEHGFRGNADAGAQVGNSIDLKTGIPVVSIYGKKQGPSAEDLKDIDIIVFDIQDVGCRFYTFLSTLQYVMEACAENNKTLIVLDRPNPNGYYVDGPVLDMKFKSFVGVAPIPVVYGLTLGEYAKMAKGENWIAGALDLKVIPCENYDHTVKYKLPVSPSPNLRDERAVFLYPSLCFFEGTNVSVGRGTDFPFQVIGSPDIPMDSADYTFMPESKPGATDPPSKGLLCKGYDLRKFHKELSTEMKGVNLKYLLKMYALTPDKDKFFSSPSFFDKLAGTDELRQEIIAGKTESEIRTGWQPALKEYKAMRKKYLLYKDFE